MHEDVGLPRTRRYRSFQITFGNRAARLCWALVYHLFVRFTPVPFHWIRRIVLRFFGATICRGARIYPSCRIWAPWNLYMGPYSVLGPGVICYNVDSIRLLAGTIVSQYSHLCTASHDYDSEEFQLVTAPITIEAGAWVAADAFVGMGVQVGEGAIVGARASVFRSVDPETIVAGNPARVIGRRRVIKRIATGQCRCSQGRQSDSFAAR